MQPADHVIFRGELHPTLHNDILQQLIVSPHDHHALQQPLCMLITSTHSTASAEGSIELPTYIFLCNMTTPLALCETRVHVVMVKVHQCATRLEECHLLQILSPCS